jgi:hypothetical protein
MPRARLLICLLCCMALLPLAGAQAVPDPKPAVNKDPAWMQAGKADAKQAFAKQAGGATQPTGRSPGFVGVYLWGGRADENYKPFHMFELRLKGGSTALAGLACRITTLSPARQSQTQGGWKTLGSLAAGASLDFDYKLNGPTFTTYQVELTWKGDKAEGKETYLAWDRFIPPTTLGELSGASYLVVLNQNFEYDAAKRVASVTYMLWNIGGQPARDVLQTIHFKDDKGKDVATFDYAPEKGEVPAGLVKEQKLTAPKIPAFANISVATRLSDNTTVADPGAFTGAKDVEIAKVRAEGKLLKARVRNGTGNDLAEVVVTISLQGKDGKVIKSFDLAVGALGKGEEREVSADLAGVPAWSGYEVGWKSSDAAARAPAPTAAPVAGQAIKVDGVEFTIGSTRAEKPGLNVIGTLSNRRDADLDGLVVTFVVPDPDAGGKKVAVELKPGRLAKGADLAIDFTAAGVKTFTGLTMTWKSVVEGVKK